MWEGKKISEENSFKIFPEDQVMKFDILSGVKTVAIKMGTKSPNFNKYFTDVINSNERIPILLLGTKAPRVEDIIIAKMTQEDEINVLIIHNDTEYDAPIEIQKVFATKKTVVPSIKDLVGKYSQNWIEKPIDCKGFRKFAKKAKLPLDLISCVMQEIKAKKAYPDYRKAAVSQYAIVEFFVYIASGFAILQSKKKIIKDQIAIESMKLPSIAETAKNEDTEIRTQTMSLGNSRLNQLNHIKTTSTRTITPKFSSDENNLQKLDDMQKLINEEKYRIEKLIQACSDSEMKGQLKLYEFKLYNKDKQIYKTREAIENLDTDIKMPKELDTRHTIRLQSKEISFDDLIDEVDAILYFSNVEGIPIQHRRSECIDIEFALPTIANKIFLLISKDNSQPFDAKLV